MSAVNLLNINVDALFEQHNIHEIDQVHKKLQQSIEEKKEELRMMVGERYRDLLQAADTISDMRKTSSDVMHHIEGIIDSCRNLNEQQLIGFKMSTSEQALPFPLSTASDIDPQPVDPALVNYYGCIGQIYLLTILPEMIWSRLDGEDYFVATQLFILGRHISTGLQLDVNYDMMRQFPVAKRQWNQLNQFFFMIKQLCLEQLEKPELSTETAVKCLASLLLLENCQLEKLLTIFIQLRTRAYRQILTMDTSTTKRHVLQSVKDRILASLQTLNETIVLMFKCFIDVTTNTEESMPNMPSKSYLMAELEQIWGANAKPTLHLMNLGDSLIIRTLPALISKFKPQVQIKPIESDAMRRAQEVWMKATESDAEQYLKKVIDSIGSIRTIQNIDRAVSELEKSGDWPNILRKLHLPNNIDFYKTFYQPLIRNRIQGIIQSSWQTIVEQTHGELSDLLEASDNKWSVQKSYWVDDHSENPLSLKEALTPNRESHKLLMKTKGYTLDICAICRNLDKNVELIYKDLDLYINGSADDNVHKRDDESAGNEQKQIVEFLQQCSQDSVMQLITNVKSLANKKVNQLHLIFLARLLKAITEICPYVKQCLMPTSLLLPSSWHKENASSVELWERTCRLLEEESIILWSHWIDLFIEERVKAHGGHCFNIAFNLTNLLAAFPRWEVFSIEEKDESNECIESIIRVPAHPSIPLQQFLFDCCKHLTAVVPNTLPKQVTTTLVDRLIERLALTYGHLLDENPFVASNQNASLQFFFDLKFLSLLLLAGRRHDEFQTLIAKFKTNIDPFDFELFHKYINTNVKLSAQRMQHHYGLLVVNPQYLSSIVATALKQGSSTGAQEKDPNLMSLCATGENANWFTLLPIVIPTKSQSTTSDTPIPTKTTASKSEKRKSPTKVSTTTPQSTAQQNLANVKSNAAAFFGAMSQDWFR